MCSNWRINQALLLCLYLYLLLVYHFASQGISSRDATLLLDSPVIHRQTDTEIQIQIQTRQMDRQMDRQIKRDRYRQTDTQKGRRQQRQQGWWGERDSSSNVLLCALGKHYGSCLRSGCFL